MAIRRGSLWKDVRPVATEIAQKCHCDRLRRAARALTLLYDDWLATSGLRLPQLTLLATIWDAGPTGIGVVALARRLDSDKSTVSRNARGLSRLGFIERGTRTRAWLITPIGCNAVAAAIPSWREAQDYFEDPIGEKTLQRLVGLRRDRLVDEPD